METFKNVKNKVEYYKVKYIPHDDPLHPGFHPMIYQDSHIKYTASCNNEEIVIFCKEDDIELIRNLENSIKSKIANVLWTNMLKEATAQELYNTLT